MKHLLSFLLSAALLLTCVYAHPGRTDGQGGHTDHSTGEYHFHHGYPAHQHPNGTCIYEFDDKTGQNSGNSGGGTVSTTKRTTTAKTTTAKATTHKTTAAKSKSDSSPIFIYILLAFVAIFCVWFCGCLLYAFVLYVIDIIKKAYHFVEKTRSEKELQVYDENNESLIYAPVMQETVSETQKRDNEISRLKTQIYQQEYEIHRKKNWIIFLIIAVICLAIFCAVSVSDKNEAEDLWALYKEKYEAAESEIIDLKLENATILNDYKKAKNNADVFSQKYNDIKYEHDFYYTYAVIAVENGYNYHKYGCHWIQNKSFYIFNKETAIAQGYKPCYDCYYEDIEW